MRTINFPGIYIYMFFLPSSMKLNINWPSGIILSTFTWKYERKYDFWLSFHMLSIVLRMIIILWP